MNDAKQLPTKRGKFNCNASKNEITNLLDFVRLLPTILRYLATTSNFDNRENSRLSIFAFIGVRLHTLRDRTQMLLDVLAPHNEMQRDRIKAFSRCNNFDINDYIQYSAYNINGVPVRV